MRCRICSSLSEPHGTAEILHRHRVSYYRCGSCGFIQTEEPYWLKDAYSEAINASDLGLISRNIAMARLTYALTQLCFDPDGCFLDYGGGYGMTVRMMRDKGLDFYRLDRYCPNLFAEGHESTNAPRDRFELVTAFEVFEHLVDPIAEIETMLGFSRNLFFTTLLVPDGAPGPQDWWYYGLEHGQHVSLFSHNALEVVAARFGLRLYSCQSFHLLTQSDPPAWRFNLAMRPPFAALVGQLRKRPSLLAADFEQALARQASEARG